MLIGITYAVILNVDYGITEINNTDLLENEVIKLINDIQNASTPASKKRLPAKMIQVKSII